MKKIIVALLAVLMLTACASKSDSTLKVANADNAVILNNGKTVFTEGDYVNALQYADNTQTYVIAALIKIAESEGIDVAEATEEQIKSVKDMLGDYYETYVIQNSGSVEFYENSVKADVAYTALLNNYINENIETLASDLAPRKIQVASFETEEEAVAAIDRIKGGEQFDAVCFELAGEQETIKPYVITEKDSKLEKEVKSAVLETEGLTNVIEVTHVTTLSSGESSSTTTYYIANVLGTNYADFTDEFKTAAAETIEGETIFATYFKKYNFEMFNAKAYKDMRNNYPSVLD